MIRFIWSAMAILMSYVLISLVCIFVTLGDVDFNVVTWGEGGRVTAVLIFIYVFIIALTYPNKYPGEG